MLNIDGLEARGVYRVNSRNLWVAVYCGGVGFIGIREKFGARYLFQEFLHDGVSPLGTVKPLELLGRIPERVRLQESLGSACMECGRGATYAAAERAWFHPDSSVLCGNPISVHNVELQALLERFEATVE